MTAQHIYIDETKQRTYVLVASVHTAGDLRALRAVVGGLLLPGQRYLHVKNESEGRKRQIAAAIVDAGVRATIYRSAAQPAFKPWWRITPQARSRCLSSTATKPWPVSTING